MSLSNYQHYKETQVDWLGKIPAHWTVQRLKWLIERNDGGAWGDDPDGVEDTVVLRSTEQSVDGFWQITEPALRKLTANERNSALLERGDLLITKSSGSSLHIGKTTLVDDEVAALTCCYSNFMQRVRMRDSFLPKLAWYIMNSELARVQFDVLSNSTTGLANLNGSMIGEVMVAVAPLAEQASIIGFLDRETSKIDALISEQEKLLELLAEKRQATISHAVTHGLNSDVSMKDSGVEWLGVIPKHWNVIRLAQLYHEISEPGEDALPILSVSIHDGVSDGELDEDEMERKVTRSDDRSKYKRVAPGDLVYNMMRAWQGGFGSVEVPGMVSPAYVVARPIGSNVATGYIEQLLRTAAGAKEAKRYSKGVTDFRLRLYWDEFKNICVPLPPKGEQVAIMHALDDSNARIDGLATEARTVISLLRERRAALVSAAVTGKIDVREHSSALAAAA